MLAERRNQRCPFRPVTRPAIPLFQSYNRKRCRNLPRSRASGGVLAQGQSLRVSFSGLAAS